MLLNAQELLFHNLLELSESQGKPAQIGYDLSVKEIKRLAKPGGIFKDKTEPPLLENLPLRYTTEYAYYLPQGVYDIMFHEGCKIPADKTGFIKHRSSLYRNGCMIVSPLFDPGFETANIGTVLYVMHPLGIYIEKDSRLGQMYFFSHSAVKEVYNGQWQNDKQRNT